MPTYEGGCLCGQSRYRARSEPFSIGYCHCRSCRRASGAPFVAWASFSKKSLEFTGTALAYYRSSSRVVRGFCLRCGGTITYQSEAAPDNVDITAATLDSPESVQPGFHIWVSHKLPWVELADGLPQYREWRPSETGS
jgi:hypothetical protein